MPHPLHQTTLCTATQHTAPDSLGGLAEEDTHTPSQHNLQNTHFKRRCTPTHTRHKHRSNACSHQATPPQGICLIAVTTAARVAPKHRLCLEIQSPSCRLFTRGRMDAVPSLCHPSHLVTTKYTNTLAGPTNPETSSPPTRPAPPPPADEWGCPNFATRVKSTGRLSTNKPPKNHRAQPLQPHNRIRVHVVGCSNAWSTRLNCEAFTMHYLQGGKQSKRQESRSKQEQERHRRPKHAGASNKRQAKDMLVQVVEHANWHKNVATTRQQHSFQRQVAALPTQSRAADTRPQNPTRRTIEYSIPPPLPLPDKLTYHMAAPHYPHSVQLKDSASWYTDCNNS